MNGWRLARISSSRISRSATANIFLCLLAFGLFNVVQPRPAGASEIPLSERRSGYDMMGPDTKAMQDDDSTNPATLSVLDGEALWNRNAGATSRSCADCHGDASTGMKGVAARYPAFDDANNIPINLDARINLCRTVQQKAPAFAHESRDLLALSTFVARQSRGMPIVSDDPRLKPFIEQGRKLYSMRQGQLNLSCAQCHDDNWGQKLAGVPIPQAHPTGYPLYRLEWQSIGSLQRRLRNCLFGMRAETYAFGALEYVALETYLMWRARGMPLESPAVRP